MPPELRHGTPIVVDLDALKRDPAPIDLIRRTAAPADAIVVRNTADGVAGLISALVRRGSRK